MSGFLQLFLQQLWQTVYAVLPVMVIFLVFQFGVIRRRVPNLKQVSVGLVYVLLGLALFLVGLEMALFPLGEAMVAQLTDPAFIQRGISQTSEAVVIHWYDYYWVYLFAAGIGFATTLAEPTLLGVAIKAEEISGGAISVWGLRITVALGVGLGVMLGSYRIVAGIPLHYFIILGCALLIVQTWLAPRSIAALAYDTGVVATSTVTVPMVVALGLGLAASVPGRNTLLDGFGLIALTCLFPIVTVLSYALLGKWCSQFNARGKSG